MPPDFILKHLKTIPHAGRGINIIVQPSDPTRSLILKNKSLLLNSLFSSDINHLHFRTFKEPIKDYEAFKSPDISNIASNVSFCLVISSKPFLILETFI